MEVHHHSHHPKKWKEYITEFLMLFLAVSLGFLAENIRESYVEKERAHELLQSFMNDVTVNVRLLDSLIEGNRKMVMKNDSSLIYLMTNKEVDLDTLYNFLPLQSFRYLNNNETYDQMKSSGSLRYIKDTNLLKEIINYNNISKATEFRSVSQEADYVGHEYTNTVQSWMPAEISIARHTGLYINRTDYKALMNNPKDAKLIGDLHKLTLNKKNIVSGNDLIKLRKELIPVITRKVSLVSGSEVFMIKTKQQGKVLLAYFKNHKE